MQARLDSFKYGIIQNISSTLNEAQKIPLSKKIIGRNQKTTEITESYVLQKMFEKERFLSYIFKKLMH